MLLSCFPEPFTEALNECLSLLSSTTKIGERGGSTPHHHPSWVVWQRCLVRHLQGHWESCGSRGCGCPSSQWSFLPFDYLREVAISPKEALKLSSEITELWLPLFPHCMCPHLDFNPKIITFFSPIAVSFPPNVWFSYHRYQNHLECRWKCRFQAQESALNQSPVDDYVQCLRAPFL